MIGTPAELKAAARGNMPKKGAQASTPVTPVNTAYEEAMRRRSTLGTSAAQRLEKAAPEYALGVYTGGVSGDLGAMKSAAVPATNPTPMLGTILRGLTASRGGLTSEGKYGGFYSAEDLASAVRGAAIGARESSVSQLRQEALKRYTQLEDLKSEASRGAQRTVLSGVTTPLPSVSPSRKTAIPGGYIEKYVNPLREYAGQLGGWYQEQARPAEEYLATAQQLEAVPLSQLAQQIAVTQYGMNPDLARSKFAGLDADYWKSKRDQKYVDTYGVPYDEFKAIQEDETKSFEQQQDRARTTLERGAANNVEKLTGFRANTFSNLIGRTPAQVAQILGDETNMVVVTNPKTGEDVEANAAWVVETARDQIESMPGQPGLDSVMAMAEQARNNKRPDIADLLLALAYMSGYRTERLENQLYLSGLTSEP